MHDCLLSQITAIILHPSFLGFLAPLKFNAGRFAELGSFSITLTAAWVLSSLLVGGYQSSATSGAISPPQKQINH